MRSPIKIILPVILISVYLVIGFFINMNAENLKIQNYQNQRVGAWQSSVSYTRSIVFSYAWPYFVAGNLKLCGRILWCGLYTGASGFGNNFVSSSVSTSIIPTTTASRSSVERYSAYESLSVGVKFQYPKAVFNLEEIKVGSEGRPGILLKSPYHVVENYKGTPDGEHTHYFSIKIYPQKGTVTSSIKSMTEEHPNYAGDIARALSDEDVELKDFYNFKKITVAGVSGISYVTGFEGSNYWYIELPKNSAEIVKIEIAFFTDFLKDNVRPSPFSEKEERSIIKEFLSSLTLIDV